MFTQPEPLTTPTGTPATNPYTYTQGFTGHTNDKTGLWPNFPPPPAFLVDFFWQNDSIRESAIALGPTYQKDPTGVKKSLLLGGADTVTFGTSTWLLDSLGLKPTTSGIYNKAFTMGSSIAETLELAVAVVTAPKYAGKLLLKELKVIQSPLKESGNRLYRSLDERDLISYDNKKGIFAKNPSEQKQLVII